MSDGWATGRRRASSIPLMVAKTGAKVCPSMVDRPASIHRPHAWNDSTAPTCRPSSPAATTSGPGGAGRPSSPPPPHHRATCRGTPSSSHRLETRLSTAGRARRRNRRGALRVAVRSVRLGASATIPWSGLRRGLPTLRWRWMPARCGRGGEVEKAVALSGAHEIQSGADEIPSGAHEIRPGSSPPSESCARPQSRSSPIEAPILSAPQCPMCRMAAPCLRLSPRPRPSAPPRAPVPRVRPRRPQRHGLSPPRVSTVKPWSSPSARADPAWMSRRETSSGRRSRRRGAM